MKVCKFCNTVCDDAIQKCPSCGGLEFSNKCENCGTVYDTSHCPNCGVKAGEVARVCPKCNTKYFSASCPTCGYSVKNVQQINNNTTNQQTINYYQTVSTGAIPLKSSPKKKLTIWRILLWIVFLPIMAIITVWKSNKLDMKWKIIITVGIIILMVILSITGQSETTATTSSVISCLV